ncbi:MAG: hypothetical protein KJ062_08505 [Thermoanaerobaculia bacterium]|nr:hypothetical protein [Thermoanaerobaculia bacterium]
MPAATHLRKVRAATAAEICEHFDLDPEARPLLGPKASPQEFLGALVAQKQFRTAIRFLAHALPHREAIWWGSLCVKHVAGDAPLPASEAAALKAAVTWVLDPSDATRNAAKAPAEAAGVETPSGGLATAVTWTGGTLAPPMPKVPPVVPGPYLPAKGVAGAVLLASVKGAGAGIEETQRLLVELGTGVAEGKVAWPDVKPRAAGRTWGF